MKSNWQTKKLGDLCEIVTDKPDKFIGTKKYYATGGINNRGDYMYKLVDYETRPGRADLLPEVGDVGFAKMKNTNKVFRIDENLKGSIFSTGFSFLRARVGILSEYLFIFVASDEFQKIKDNFAGYGIMGGIRKSDIGNIELSLPPVEIQKIIIKIVNEVFKKTAKAKENAEKNLQNARELFESYLQSVFTNPGDEWEEKKLGEIIKLEYGKPLPNSKRKSDGVYPVYGANGEKDRSNEYYYDKYSIIVGRKGSAGEINLTEERFWPLDVTYFVTFDLKKHDLYFIYYILNHLKLPKLAKGVKPGINRNEVYSIDLHIPPLSEQRRIVVRLNALSAETKKLEAIYQQKLNDLEELKKSILQKAFKGELVEV